MHERGLAQLAPGTLGAGIAGRHVWLQNLPADQVPACGPGLSYMLEQYAVMRMLQQVYGSEDATLWSQHWRTRWMSLSSGAEPGVWDTSKVPRT